MYLTLRDPRPPCRIRMVSIIAALALTERVRCAVPRLRRYSNHDVRQSDCADGLNRWRGSHQR